MIWVYAWLAGFGLWPIADPGHGWELLSMVDIGVHVYGFTGVWRWVKANEHRTFEDIWRGQR